MSELKPTTKAERDSKEFIYRLITDIDRRDVLLRRLVEWWEDESSAEDAEMIVADARKLLEDSQ